MPASSKQRGKDYPISSTDDTKHPGAVIADAFNGDKDRYLEIMGSPLHENIFIIWAMWLKRVMRDHTVNPNEDFDILLAALQRRGITNGQFQEACELIESNQRKFPHVADFAEIVRAGQPGEHDPWQRQRRDR